LPSQRQGPAPGPGRGGPRRGDGLPLPRDRGSVSGGEGV